MKLKAVYLEWDDAEFHEQGWNVYDAARTPTLVKTIAWLIAETDKELTVSASCDVQPIPHWSDQFSIPKSAIRKRKAVKVP